ncbi:uncharacterized protein LOC113313969 [Papaver somniferum]|uniref:uncharacterized protein LOC113313969 n=1 Tax=Papaver somniferum TaxID=3469 RepID=UPI000E7035ED|nr:uncharacterized protein LOC113313969 [Papaver somniferum]
MLAECVGLLWFETWGTWALLGMRLDMIYQECQAENGVHTMGWDRDNNRCCATSFPSIGLSCECFQVGNRAEHILLKINPFLMATFPLLSCGYFCSSYQEVMEHVVGVLAGLLKGGDE